jgi:poly(A) polymerase
LSRAEHDVSRKNISSAALRVLYGLKEAGFQAHLVGGGVRDLLLGLAPKDFDVATDATPEQVRKVFRQCRLIGRRFVIAHVRFGDEIIEVTTFRGTGDALHEDREIKAGGQILRDNVFGTLEEDALRRDFTVNALYYNIDDYSVVDYVGGLDDLKARRLRLIGDPETRYREDPVRMLRAARFAGKLGFEIDPGTLEPIERLAGLLDGIPPARLFDDLMKLFLYGHAERSFDRLLSLKLFEHLFPTVSLADANIALIRAALRSTDERVAVGKPVTPAFLFAAILWSVYRQRLGTATEDGAVDDAAENVFARASQRVAIPRRFSVVTRDIWWMQQRLIVNSAARARRVMRHPKFRAGFDFLLLRAQLNPALAPLARLWEQLQSETPPGESAFADLADEGGTAAKPRRRRRRRGAGKRDDSNLTVE